MTEKTLEQLRTDFVDALARWHGGPNYHKANPETFDAARALLAALQRKEETAERCCGYAGSNRCHCYEPGGKMYRACGGPIPDPLADSAPAPPKPAERTAEEILARMLGDLHDPARGERIREVIHLVRELRAERDELEQEMTRLQGNVVRVENKRDALAARIEKAKGFITRHDSSWGFAKLRRVLSGEGE